MYEKGTGLQPAQPVESLAGASVVWNPSTDVTADSLEPISGVNTTSDLPGILIDGTGEETG
jgi:hypothetical protein